MSGTFSHLPIKVHPKSSGFPFCPRPRRLGQRSDSQSRPRLIQAEDNKKLSDHLFVLWLSITAAVKTFRAKLKRTPVRLHMLEFVYDLGPKRAMMKLRERGK